MKLLVLVLFSTLVIGCVADDHYDDDDYVDYEYYYENDDQPLEKFANPESPQYRPVPSPSQPTDSPSRPRPYGGALPPPTTTRPRRSSKRRTTRRRTTTMTVSPTITSTRRPPTTTTRRPTTTSTRRPPTTTTRRPTTTSTRRPPTTTTRRPTTTSTRRPPTTTTRRPTTTSTRRPPTTTTQRPTTSSTRRPPTTTTRRPTTTSTRRPPTTTTRRPTTTSTRRPPTTTTRRPTTTSTRRPPTTTTRRSTTTSTRRPPTTTTRRPTTTSTRRPPTTTTRRPTTTSTRRPTSTTTRRPTTTSTRRPPTTTTRRPTTTSTRRPPTTTTRRPTTTSTRRPTSTTTRRSTTTSTRRTTTRTTRRPTTTSTRRRTTSTARRPTTTTRRRTTTMPRRPTTTSTRRRTTTTARRPTTTTRRRTTTMPRRPTTTSTRQRTTTTARRPTTTTRRPTTTMPRRPTSTRRPTITTTRRSTSTRTSSIIYRPTTTSRSTMTWTATRSRITTTRPRCTGPNEMYSLCDNNSCQRNCDTFSLRSLFCRPICTPGCICRRGYLRNRDGICVLANECENDVCPGPNEDYVTCSNPCESCLDRNTTCRVSGCIPGCNCQEGYYRNLQGECVPEGECECPLNEILEPCLVPYPPDTCDAIGHQLVCSVLNNDDCHPGCRCKKNFKRNCDGVCVDIRQCEPLKCGKNEVYNPCPPSPRCIDQRCVPVPARVCPLIWDQTCYPRCLCKEGYCKDDRGKCVPKSCGGDPNAEYDSCGDSCPASCENPLGPPACIKRCERGGCRCKKGYVRNYKGRCILSSECPKCSGANEEFKCGSPCDAFCSALNRSCPLVGKPCIPRCYCKRGYARNADNQCVLVASCPPRPRCRRNEVFERCPGHEACCQDDFQGIQNFKAPEICVPRCRCAPGYVRKDDGRCVLPKDCCRDPNAQVVSCKDNCPSGTCAKPKDIHCDRHCEVFPKGCQCKNGYVRISENNPKCIPQGACPKRRRKHKKISSEEEEHDEHM